MISFALAGLLLSAQPPNCSDPQNRSDMNQCAARAANEADADLNLIWPQVVARYEQMDRDSKSKEGVKRLRAAQRAWMAFRDAECAVTGYDALGGTMEAMLVAGCAAELTKRRAAELRQMLINR